MMEENGIMKKIEAKKYIEFTYEGVIERFYEGDKVVCYIDNEEFAGTVKSIGMFSETENSEPVMAICLDTSKSVWSYSNEIIKFDDIVFMCKDFLADIDVDTDISDEEAQKNTYIHMFTGMGYDRFKVEKTWNSLNELMKQFDIPFEKAMGCMTYALKYDCGIEVPLKNICGIDVELLQKSMPAYQKEMAKCFGMVLASGLVYLLADRFTRD